MTKLTKAQADLLATVRSKAPEAHGLRAARGGFKTADVLIAAGILRDVTKSTDYTRFVVEA